VQKSRASSDPTPRANLIAEWISVDRAPRERSYTVCHLGRVVHEDDRPQALIIVLWDAAGETCRIVRHDEASAAQA